MCEKFVHLLANEIRLRYNGRTEYNRKTAGGLVIMTVVKELIRTEEDGTLSFGDYELKQKSKVSDFRHQGDMYKVKTFYEITKLEKNGVFVYESVPGTSVFHLKHDENVMEFAVGGCDGTHAQVTVELEAETEYEVMLDGSSAGKMVTNLGGKLSFSVDFENDANVEVKIAKC